MPICFLKKSSGNKPASAAAAAAAAEPAKPKPSPSEFEAAGAMEQFVMPGAEYAPHNRRLKNIQMIKYNFDDDQHDDYSYGTQDMYYPNYHGGYHSHAIAAPAYHHGMRHMSAPPPQYSNYPPPPPPYGHGHGHGHYPPALPHRHFSPAPPPWQRYSPAPAPWGLQFGHRQQFGPPRPHFGPPRRPFAPPMGHDYYGDY